MLPQLPEMKDRGFWFFFFVKISLQSHVFVKYNENKLEKWKDNKKRYTTDKPPLYNGKFSRRKSTLSNCYTSFSVLTLHFHSISSWARISVWTRSSHGPLLEQPWPGPPGRWPRMPPGSRPSPDASLTKPADPVQLTPRMPQGGRWGFIRNTDNPGKCVPLNLSKVREAAAMALPCQEVLSQSQELGLN